MLKRFALVMMIAASANLFAANQNKGGDGSGIGGTGMKPGGGIGGTGRSGSMDEILPERVELPERIERPELEPIDKPDFERPELDGLSPAIDGTDLPDPPDTQN